MSAFFIASKRYLVPLAKALNRAAFPSITGIAALAPTFPRPKTADPSEIIAS